MKRLMLIAVLAACDDPEVTGKVASVLEHGAIEAQADCYAQDTHQFFPTGGQGTYIYTYGYRVKLQRLVDGSAFFSVNGRGDPANNPVPEPALLSLCDRGSACAGGLFETTVATVPAWPGNLTGTQVSIAVQDGLLSVTLEDPGFSVYNASSPFEWLSEPIESVCTGFNLEAFGVSP